MGEYLVYHIDKSLGIVPTQVLDRTSFTAVREEGRDQ